MSSTRSDLMKHTHLLVTFFILIFGLLAYTQDSLARLPEKSEVIGLRLDSLRADGVLNNIKFNFNTEEMFHPYFTESINAILRFYKSHYILAKQLDHKGQEPTADAYINVLRENHVTIYKMRDLQGRVLRILINQQIPVLAIKKIQTITQNLNILRTQGSVIYLYREPNFTQSSNKLPGDKKYEFMSAFGATWVTPDIEKIGLAAYDYLCVMVTPEMSLKTIKDRINDGLSDVGFEYKLPEFEELKGENLTW
jgi:hypothetical protein